MKQYLFNNENIREFALHLAEDEKSPATVEKYLRDVNAFFLWCEGKVYSKQTFIQYKQKLTASGYSVSSVNSMLAALNSFFDFMGWKELNLRYLKMQKQIYRPQDKELTKEEYKELSSLEDKGGKSKLNE